jgi:hypothetical protein
VEQGRNAYATPEGGSDMGQTTRYTVLVGNIGQVLDTADHDQAVASYEEYILDSINNYGRAAGESVTLLKDGKPIREYAGTLGGE